ncbi:NVEALA domain-containing protein [Parabacteroides sp.]
MKKKTLVKLILAAGCLMAAYCFSGNRETTDLNKLAFQNIEALAQGENDADANCFGCGSVDCRGHKVEYKISGLSLE